MGQASGLHNADGNKKKSNWASAFDKAPGDAASRMNPYDGKPDAILAGAKLFRRHCGDCHGMNAEGTSEAPSLRSSLLQTTTPGTLFWFLKNGNLRRGMPSWSGLPEQQRWQIVSFLKSINSGKESER